VAHKRCRIIVATVGVFGTSIPGCAAEPDEPVDQSMSLGLASAGDVAVAPSVVASGDPVATPLPMYDLRFIGPVLGGNSVEERAVAINNNGIIAGKAYVQFQPYQSFTHDGCSVKIIPPLPSADGMEASDINDSGTVVGTASTPTGQHPFKSAAGVTTDLDELEDPDYGGAIAVGPSDITLGLRNISVYFLFGKSFALSPFQMPFGPQQQVDAMGMNRYFSVVGQVRPGVGVGNPFGVVSGGGFTGWSQIKGVGNETEMQPRAINDNGHIVGDIVIPLRGRHAFLSINPAGKARDIGFLVGASSTSAVAINNSDDIVGYSVVGSGVSGQAHAVVWHGGVIADLNTRVLNPGPWVLETANDINDHGIIVGNAVQDGYRHAFILTPHDPQHVTIANCIGPLE